MSIWLWFISGLWAFRAVRVTLFWLYLWQLKEYHIGRFADHFRTAKGKQLLGNAAQLAKLAMLLVLLLAPFSFPVVALAALALYAVEGLAFARAIARGRLLSPVPTAKILLLETVSFALVALLWLQATERLNDFWLLAALLLADVLLPAILSAIVLALQPLFVLGRMRTLRRAAQKISRYPNLKVIAVTGSYGKTSAKEFLTTLLSPRYRVLSTREHRNSEMGIARTILQELNETHEIFVVEMGAYRKGGIKLLCDMVKPSVGVVTGVNAQHLATFGSMENLLSAEGGGELLNALPAAGLLVVNGGNQYCRQLFGRARVQKKLYAASRGQVAADVWAEELSLKKDSLSFAVRTAHGRLGYVSLAAHGAHQLENMLGAITVALELGMDLEEIERAARHIRAEQGGITVRRGAYGIWVIDASYSANPDGVLADLDYLKLYEGKRAVVMPCLIELGPKSAEIHRQIGGRISRVCRLAVITSRDRLDDIRQGAATAAEPAAVAYAERPEEIFELITTHLSEGDAVLLEGRVPPGLIPLLHGKTK